MLAINTEFSRLTWDIIRDVALAGWVIVPLLWRYVKPWWEDRSFLQLTPSRKSARDLRRLAKNLGRMRFWLKYDSEMMRRIRRTLFEAERRIIAEASAYLAVHSNDDTERSSALLFLSQVEGDEDMEYAAGVIGSVANERAASEKVRNVARAALNEIKERGRMIKEGIAAEQKEDSEGQ